MSGEETLLKTEQLERIEQRDGFLNLNVVVIVVVESAVVAALAAAYAISMRGRRS